MIDENEKEEEFIESLGLKSIAYNNIVDRYYSKYYFDEGTENEQFIFIHTNGLVMCGLGSNHRIVKSGVKIKEIKDLNKVMKVSGKRKHGAHILSDSENILKFELESEDDKNSGDVGVGDTQDVNVSQNRQNKNLFSFSPRVKGKLLEINSEIFIDSDVVKRSPEKHGFLCFILMNDPKASESLIARLEKMKLANK